MKAKFPPLTMIPIEDLIPGHVLWGWEKERNYSRKGWHLENEGQEVLDVEESDGHWAINEIRFTKDESFPEYVLIEVPQ